MSDTTRRSRLAVFVASGVAALVAGWTLVAWRQPTVVVASPAETVDRLLELGAGDIGREVVQTGWRALRGTIAGVAVGVVLGFVTGRYPTFDWLLRPTRAVLAGAPPIVALVLIAIWVGLDGDATPWVVAVAAAPVVWIAVHEAVRDVDPDLLEMAAGLRVGRRWTLRHVTIPAIAPALRASGAYAAANAYRITIMAELFVSTDGIGARIARARNALDTPAVFAWALVAVVAALVIEAATLGVGRSGGRMSTDISGPMSPDGDEPRARTEP